MGQETRKRVVEVRCPVTVSRYLYLKPPFGGPEAVLAYLSRYTRRVAIANSRLIAFNENGVTFRYKDYRADGRARYKTMTLATRVHPPLPHPRPAARFPPHPTLWPVRQWQPCTSNNEMIVWCQIAYYLGRQMLPA